MRNLLEYPITMDEVIVALETAIKREDEDGRYGNINGYILERIHDLASKVFTEKDFNL